MHNSRWLESSGSALRAFRPPSPMSPDLERLIALQQVESAIAEARERIAVHPQRLASADARLEEARHAVEIVKQRLKENQEARREVEKTAAMYQSRLSKFKDQLSEVKTNREYQAMQHEIATAQSDLGTAEERVLERMVEADTIAAELKRAEAVLVERSEGNRGGEEAPRRRAGDDGTEPLTGDGDTR